VAAVSNPASSAASAATFLPAGRRLLPMRPAMRRLQSESSWRDCLRKFVLRLIPNGEMTMTLRSAQYLLIARAALALAAVLLHSATAFSAEAADGGQERARALLSAATEARTQQASTELPSVCLTAFAIDAQDQARALLAQGASCAERRFDESADGVTGSAGNQSAGNQDTVFSGAQESARKMILGRDA